MTKMPVRERSTTENCEPVFRIKLFCLKELEPRVALQGNRFIEIQAHSFQLLLLYSRYRS